VSHTVEKIQYSVESEDGRSELIWAENEEAAYREWQLLLEANGLTLDEIMGVLETTTVEPYVDDDPVCVCGTHRSEHALCGCPEGFQTPEDWRRERDAIYRRSALEDENGRFYGDDEW